MTFIRYPFRCFYFVLIGFLALAAQLSQAQTISYANRYYQTGTQYATRQFGNEVFSAGSFGAVGKPYAGGVIANRSTGEITGPLVGPTSGGAILSSVPDGSGGWYVGGNFTVLSDGTVRNRLMHILADQSVDPAFVANVDNNVNSLAKIGNTLFLAGAFTTINGQARSRLASIDLTTNTLSTWDPAPNNTVTTVYADGTTLYVAGAFTQIAGVSRSHVTSFDATTGLVSALSIPANNTVNAVAVSGNTLYVAGLFTTILSTGRNRLAAIELSTTTLLPLALTINNGINAIALNGNSLFIGGFFTNINSTTVLRFAEVDLTTNTLTSFRPSPSQLVRSIVVNGNDLFIGGNFSAVETSIIRVGLAVYDLTTKTVKSFNTGANDIYTISVNGSNVLAGGNFNLAGRIDRQGLYSFDAQTGAISSWNPGITGGSCIALETDGTNLFVGGDFGLVAGNTRQMLFSINAATKALNPLSISIDQRVMALKLVGNILYIGGAFTSVGGQPRNGIAAIDISTNSVTSWNPNLNANAFIHAIEEHNGKVWFGGHFSTVNGATRKNLGVVNASDATLDPNYGGTAPVDGLVRCFAKYNGLMYVGGEFTQFFGQTRRGIGAVSLTTGALNSFNVNDNNAVLALQVRNNHLLIGGSFSTFMGMNRSGFAALRLTDMTLEPALTLEPNGQIYSVLMSDSKLFLGGFIQTVGYSPQAGFVGYDIDCSALPTPTITANGPVAFCDGDQVILSGPAGYNYLWSTGETTQQIAVSTAANVTLQLVSGFCTTAASAPVAVSLLPCRLKRYIGIGNWTDVANWSGNSLPLAADTVVVMPGAILSMNTAATIRSLRVMGTAIMTMTTSADLTVTSVGHNLGTINNINGTTGALKLGGSGTAELLGNKWSTNQLILLSNVKTNSDIDVWARLDLNGNTFNVNNKTVALRFQGTNTAELLQPAGSTLVNASSFRVDRRYPVSLSTIGTNGGAWILVGAPTSNQNVNAWNQGNFYAYSWLNGIYNGSSIYTYDPFYTLPLSKGYKKPIGPTQAAPIGVGHRVWFRYNEFFQGPNQGGQSYSGTPHIGNFTWNLAYCASGCADTLLPNTNTGYNMIGNPYAATIDWDAPTGWTRNNVFNALYIHKSISQNVASFVGGVGNNGGSRYLPVGQGFFVWANAAGATMTATPEVIAPGINAGMLRTPQVVDVLRFNVSGNNSSDEAVIRFTQSATPGFDMALDARKMNNFSGLNFSFQDSSNADYAIMAEPFPAQQSIYRMKLEVPQSGNYQIQFDGMATLTNNWSVFLKDNDLNTMVPVVDGLGYSFIESAGTTGRFSLVVMPQWPTSLGQQLKPVLTLRPNPATTSVQLNVVNGQFKHVEVVDKLGRTVLTTNTLNGDILDISTLAAGAYLVKVQTDRGVLTQRLSVIR